MNNERGRSSLTCCKGNFHWMHGKKLFLWGWISTERLPRNSVFPSPPLVGFPICSFAISIFSSVQIKFCCIWMPSCVWLKTLVVTKLCGHPLWSSSAMGLSVLTMWLLRMEILGSLYSPMMTGGSEIFRDFRDYLGIFRDYWSIWTVHSLFFPLKIKVGFSKQCICYVSAPCWMEEGNSIGS